MHQPRAAEPGIQSIYVQQRVQAERIVAQAFNSPHPPILIYQMGKVGSTAIDVALRRAGLPNAIFKPHTLANTVNETYRILMQKRAPVPPHLAIEAALQRAIASGRLPPKLFVITLFRDPIARLVSVFFENPHSYPAPVFDGQGNMHADAAVRYLRHHLTAERILHDTVGWFERELATHLERDVFGLPFDKERGWTVHRDRGIDLLVMQTEAIVPEGHKALASLLHVPRPIPIPRARARETMPFAEAYAEVKRTLRLPTKVCDAVYSDPRVHHFYTDAQIAEFRSRWEEGANRKDSRST